MTKEKLRIVFMGTPDFAVASLKALLDHHFNVVAVVTAPDKPAGRGMQLKGSAVKDFAQSQGLLVLQPERLKSKRFLSELKDLKTDVQVVVAFRMLPEVVWNMPPLGTINVHGSLLPQYRGAAPINWAIINGEQETGVTTFKLKHAIDTGDMLLQHREAIQPEDDFGTMYYKLMEAGAQLLVKTLEQMLSGQLKPQPQAAQNEFKHAPKIFKEDGAIDWNAKAKTIQNLIRGLSPIPAAYTQLQGKQLKIYRARIEEEPISVAPGTVESDGKSYLRFAALDGWLYAELLQLEGKKKMTVEDFLRGFKLALL